MIFTYGRNIKGSYKVIESCRPQQKYWHFFKPKSYAVEGKQRLQMKSTCCGCFFLDTDEVSNGPYTWLYQTSKFQHQFSFGYSFELFCIFLKIHLFKLSQIYNFKTRLGKICSYDVNAKGYYHGPLTLQPLKYIPLVVIDRRENSCGIFYHYYFSWIDTRLIKHINLPGLALSQGQSTKRNFQFKH